MTRWLERQDAPPPPGYVEIYVPRFGPIVTGSVFLVLGAFITVGIATSDAQPAGGYLAVPAVGPFWAASAGPDGAPLYSIGVFFAGLFRYVGGLLVTIGLTARRRRVVPISRANIELVPLAHPGGAGLALAWR